MIKKRTKYKHVLLFIAALLSMLFYTFFGGLSSPTISSIGSVEAPLASDWKIFSAFDSNVLRLLSEISYPPDQDGAASHNKQGYISVEFQRYSTPRIVYGIQTKNVQLIEGAVKSFEYAFAHQNPDGSFQYTLPGAVSKPTAAVIASSLAGFYSDFGHCLLLLQDSDWFQKSKEMANLRVRLNKLLRPTALSLTWLMGQEAALRNYHQKTTNLIFLDAAAYYLVGKALHNSDTVRLGESFVRLALQKQTEAGFFLEKGGYDSSYQAFALRQAIALYSNLEPDAVSLRQDLWKAIERGMRWELSRILPTGEISTEGNTRVHPNGEKSFGKEKGANYTDVTFVLNYYSALSSDRQVKIIADQVLTFKREKGKNNR